MIGVITEDGSLTCYDEKTEEFYHSLSGAKEEAREKHVAPVLDFLKKNNDNKELVVLDFCFGLGYNSYVFIEEMLKINKDAKIKVIAIDNDQEIVDIAFNIFDDFLNEIKSNKNIAIEVIMGDAKEKIKEIKEKIDVCFFDPFSPKKKPELWSEEVFRNIYNLMKGKAILTTYSCAKSIRENMKKAGFIVTDGPIIGRWCPATLGIKDG
jgi:predicted methyltransferase